MQREAIQGNEMLTPNLFWKHVHRNDMRGHAMLCARCEMRRTKTAGWRARGTSWAYSARLEALTKHSRRASKVRPIASLHFVRAIGAPHAFEIKSRYSLGDDS